MSNVRVGNFFADDFLITSVSLTFSNGTTQTSPTNFEWGHPSAYALVDNGEYTINVTYSNTSNVIGSMAATFTASSDYYTVFAYGDPVSTGSEGAKLRVDDNTDPGTNATGSSPSSSGTPWWYWLILGVIILAVILLIAAAAVGGWFFYQKKKRATYETIVDARDDSRWDAPA